MLPNKPLSAQPLTRSHLDATYGKKTAGRARGCSQADVTPVDHSWLSETEERLILATHLAEYNQR